MVALGGCAIGAVRGVYGVSVGDAVVAVGPPACDRALEVEETALEAPSGDTETVCVWIQGGHMSKTFAGMLTTLVNGVLTFFGHTVIP